MGGGGLCNVQQVRVTCVSNMGVHVKHLGVGCLKCVCVCGGVQVGSL